MGKRIPADSSLRIPADSSLPYARVYARICETLGRDRMRQERMGEEEFTHVNEPELVRFLKRLGAFPRSWPTRRALLSVAAVVARMAAADGVSPAQVQRDLLAFCSCSSEGAICSASPRCGECPLSNLCEYPQRSAAGEEGLSDAELLAIIIGGGSKSESALELARKLLARFGDFRRLAGCSVGELTCVRGIGQAKAAQIKAALAIARRYATEKITVGEGIRGSRQLFDHYREQFSRLKKETFYCILLDTKHRVIKEERIAVGSLNESVVHPREVFRPAVAESAARVIFIHNHPSGNPEPSPQDRSLTRRLCEAGQLVGIEVLDHVIIGRDGYFSFAEERLI